jgi:hypothetical protein
MKNITNFLRVLENSNKLNYKINKIKQLEIRKRKKLKKK